MKKNLSEKILLFFLAIVLFIMGWYSHAFLRPASLKYDAEMQRLNQMIEIMSSKWYYATESSDIYKELINKAMTGITTFEFDPYTEYFSREDLEGFEQAVNQTYTGIGVEMSMATEYPLIIRVFYDSPAEKAGLQPGDYITAVDGIDIKGKTYEEIKPMITGEEGTMVNVTYQRLDSSKEIAIKRANISYTVMTDIIDDKIAYLQITTFGSGTATEFIHALDVIKEKNIDKLIIDLRDNGGGYLDVLLKMADCFLEKNEIVFKQVYINNNEEFYRASTNKIYHFDKIVILINEYTASASEVFASCLQDYGIATLVGEKSYGKGTSQNIYDFADGSALKYTQSHWYSAKGRQINGIGITPDYQVELPKFLTMMIPEVEGDIQIKYDQVSEIVAYVQSGLKEMNYKVDREDGYFSSATLKAVREFQVANNLPKNDYIDNEFFLRFVAVCRQYYNDNLTKLDTQYAKALELVS